MARQEFTIFKRRSAKGGYVYHFFYWIGDRRYSKSTKKRTKAEGIIEARRQLEAMQNPAQILEGFALGFYDWDTSAWIRRQLGKKRHISREVARSRASQLERYILPRFGKTTLNDINAVAIENWLMDLNLSNQTRNHIWYSLRIILKEAARAGLIDGVPPVEPMGADSRETDVFTAEEYGQLFPEDQEELINVWGSLYFAAAFMVMASTGIRPGELRALRWRDFFGPALWIERAAKDLSGIGSTKGGYARPVALPSRTERILIRWHEETPFPDPEALVFYGAMPTNPLYRKNLNQALTIAIVAAGVQVGERELTPRCFRHSYNTMMRRVLPAEQLRLMIGHRDAKMSELYDHPTQAQMLSEVGQNRKVLNSVWGPS